VTADLLDALTELHGVTITVRHPLLPSLDADWSPWRMRLWWEANATPSELRAMSHAVESLAA